MECLNLAEDLFHLVEQAARLRLVLHDGHCTKLFQQLLLALVQARRRLHANAHEQIALARALQGLQAFPADAERGAALRALRYFQLVLTVQGRDHDLASQGCLGEGNRYRAVEILAFALEEGMRLHSQHDVKIARRRAVRTGIALLLIADSGAVFHAGRHRNIHGTLAHHPGFSAALAARIGDYMACPLAGGTGSCDRENALLIPDLSVTAASRACRRPPAAGRATAVTLLARLVTTHLDLCLLAEGRFFKGQRQIRARVTATLGTTTAPSTHIHAEEVAEDIAKDVAEIGER